MHIVAIVVAVIAIGVFLGRSFARAARSQRAVLLDQDRPVLRRFVYQPLPTTIV